jgi:hypothetical protein
MSAKILSSAVKDAVSKLVQENRVFDLVNALGMVNVPNNVVIDIDFVERSLDKLFYTDFMKNYDKYSVDGKVVFAPSGMTTKAISNALAPKFKTVKIAKRNIVFNTVYSPDSRGRIRFPVRLTSTMDRKSNKVWVVKSGDDINVTSYKPRTISKPKQYTVDTYGNLLIKAPSDSMYEMKMSRRGRLVASPLKV